ncbi:MAG: hypothetical protein LC650_00920 [Actinobacteria bacterium]|nr:hypothetical protein [Actinomycetota bacterium]
MQEDIRLKSRTLVVLRSFGDETERQQNKPSSFTTLVDGESRYSWQKGGEVQMVEDLEDDVLQIVSRLFSPWEPGILVYPGELYQWNGGVVEVIQEHTTQADWTPDKVPALFKDHRDSTATLDVGDSSATFDKTHTALQGTSESFALEAGYPQRESVNEVSYKIVADKADANFHWREIGLFNSDGDMLIRDVQDLGLKPSTQIWELTVIADVQNP